DDARDARRGAGAAARAARGRSHRPLVIAARPQELARHSGGSRPRFALLPLATPARRGERPRHSAVYGLGSLVSRFIAVLLLPVYTRYLSPADYGLIDTLIPLSGALSVLL